MTYDVIAIVVVVVVVVLRSSSGVRWDIVKQISCFHSHTHGLSGGLLLTSSFTLPTSCISLRITSLSFSTSYCCSSQAEHMGSNTQSCSVFHVDKNFQSLTLSTSVYTPQLLYIQSLTPPLLHLTLTMTWCEFNPPPQILAILHASNHLSVEFAS